MLRQQKQWLAGKNKDLENELERKTAEVQAADSSQSNSRNQDSAEASSDRKLQMQQKVPQVEPAKEKKSTKSNSKPMASASTAAPGRSEVSADLRNLLLGSGKRS